MVAFLLAGMQKKTYLWFPALNLEYRPPGFSHCSTAMVLQSYPLGIPLHKVTDAVKKGVHLVKQAASKQ